MNKLLYILALSLTFFSCEDVIDVEVPIAAPKLVIEGSINWLDGTDGKEQTIDLSLSAPFFDAQIPPALGATVTVTNENNNRVFNFLDNDNNGSYVCTDFLPVLNTIYTLNIIYKGETYTGKETMTTVVPIDFVQQVNDGGFSGEETEIKAFYTDPEAQENYYFFSFQEEDETNPYLSISDDEFINGNQVFAFYTNENTEAGKQITIRSYGVSKQFAKFMDLLLQQSADEDGGPFEVQPATVRGNCINVTNPDNFPFGYFRTSHAYEIIYTVE